MKGVCKNCQPDTIRTVEMEKWKNGKCDNKNLSPPQSKAEDFYTHFNWQLKNSEGKRNDNV